MLKPFFRKNIFLGVEHRSIVIFLAYILTSLPLIIFLSFFRPPIGVADEWSHIARAVQLADGHLFTQVAEAGKPPMGSIDPNFLSLTNQVHQRRVEVMADLLPDLQAIPWSQDRILANYNSSVYFPAPYVASILAFKTGSLFGANIVATLQIVNLFNGLMCMAITALAIALAPRGKVVIFVVAILPMTLYLFASASPDGPLICSSLLAFALLGRSAATGNSDPGRFLALTVLGTVIAATKLPYLPLTLAVITATWLASTRRRPAWSVPVGAALFVAGVSIAWSIVTKAGSIDVTWGANVGKPSQQVAFLLQNPSAVVTLAWQTLSAGGWGYLHQMVGYLGWHDAPISFVGQAVLLMLIAAAFVLDSPTERFGSVQVSLLLGLLASVGAVFFSLYVAANPLGSLGPIVGVQGRYFLPLVIFMVFLLPSVVRFQARGVLLALVLAAAIPISTFELMQAVFDRYYV